jgi:hypothetical protein
MAVTYNPRIVTDGLVLALDAGNSRSFDSNENLLAYSEDFSNAYWTKSDVSITSNAMGSPTGSSNASKLVESASTAVHELYRSDGALSVGTDTYITFSIFAKAAERQYCYIRSSGNSKRIAVVVDLSNGTFNVTNWGFTLNSSATVTAYPNGWYRITATAQSNYPTAPGWSGNFFVSPLDSYQLASNVGASGYSYAGNGTSGIYIWGAHYELGPGISNYYATTGTAKTRGTIWTDLSSDGNTGTLTNGPTYNSSNGGSITFNGTNYISSFPTQISATGSRTVSCFFRTNVTTRNGLCGTRGNAVATGWVLTVNQPLSGSLNYFHTAGSSISVAAGISINTWYNACVTYDVATATTTLYLNGAQIGDPVTSFSAMTPSVFNGAIGAEDGQFNNKFNGNIAQVQIYNRALSVTEVRQNFNALRGRYGI